MPEQTLRTGCCITGGGPAGMMLGFLLARAGIEVAILEKHGDFLRDFRGDTIHPSTLELIYELGLLSEFLQRPHQEVRQITGFVGDSEVIVGDFTHLPTHCKFLAFMPQWDFLNFLAEQGSRYPTFHVHMKTEVTKLVEENGRVIGVEAKTPGGPLQVRANLVVGADGRHSTVREQADFTVRDMGAPIDVLWMRVSRRDGDPHQPLGRFNRGKVLVMLDRGDFWQCAFVIPKGGIEDIHSRGLPAFRAAVADVAPFLKDRLQELTDWNDIKLLTVLIERLVKWSRPGLLCIGDAAHAMSPIGGVGINLAIQDAVATANLLAEPLRHGIPPTSLLEQIQRRREWPARVTQRMQIIIQDRVLTPALATRKQLSLPWLLRFLRRWPRLRRIPARIVGLGFRPEHVRTPDVFKSG